MDTSPMKYVPIPTNDHQIRFADQWPPSFLLQATWLSLVLSFGQNLPMVTRTHTFAQSLAGVADVWNQHVVPQMFPKAFLRKVLGSDFEEATGRFRFNIIREHDTLSQCWVFPVRDLDLNRREMSTKTSGHESTRFKESLSFSFFFSLCCCYCCRMF